MTSLKLELGYPACSELCQHPSCWPSYSPAPSNRGLEHPRMKRLIQAQAKSQTADSLAYRNVTVDATLPTLKILDIGKVSDVELASSPSPTSFFPAVSSSRRSTRTATHTHRSRSRAETSLLTPETPSPSQANRRTPLFPRTENKLRSLPVRLNYVTVHDPTNPVTSPPDSKQLTWLPATPDKRPRLHTQTLQISPLKNVTSQLIEEGFEDVGDVVTAYPKTCALPVLQTAWLSWEDNVISTVRTQLDAKGEELSSRSDISYLSNKELFLSGRGMWRPRKTNKRNSLKPRVSAARAPTVSSHQIHQFECPPHLSQVSISLEDVPHIPKRIPVVLERFLSQKRSPPLAHTSVATQPVLDPDRYLLTDIDLMNAPPPTPDCLQTLTRRKSLRVHLPTSPTPLQPNEP